MYQFSFPPEYLNSDKLLIVFQFLSSRSPLFSMIYHSDKWNRFLSIHYTCKTAYVEGKKQPPRLHLSPPKYLINNMKKRKKERKYPRLPYQYRCSLSPFFFFSFSLFFFSLPSKLRKTLYRFPNYIPPPPALDVPSVPDSSHEEL